MEIRYRLHCDSVEEAEEMAKDLKEMHRSDGNDVILEVNIYNPKCRVQIKEQIEKQEMPL